MLLWWRPRRFRRHLPAEGGVNIISDDTGASAAEREKEGAGVGGGGGVQVAET